MIVGATNSFYQGAFLHDLHFGMLASSSQNRAIIYIPIDCKLSFNFGALSLKIEGPEADHYVLVRSSRSKAKELQEYCCVIFL